MIWLPDAPSYCMQQKLRDSGSLVQSSEVPRMLQALDC
jgi:hypothetical protein